MWDSKDGKEMNCVDFTNVRSDIRKMFVEQGHSRVPMDYAQQWLLENTKNITRDDYLIRIYLEPCLTKIAEEIMEDEGLKIARHICMEELKNEN